MPAKSHARWPGHRMSFRAGCATRKRSKCSSLVLYRVKIVEIRDRGAVNPGVSNFMCCRRRKSGDCGRTDMFRRIEIELHQARITSGVTIEDSACSQGRLRMQSAPASKTGSQYFECQYRGSDLGEPFVRFLGASSRGCLPK